jgi:hypothetical protein
VRIDAQVIHVDQLRSHLSGATTDVQDTLLWLWPKLLPNQYVMDSLRSNQRAKGAVCSGVRQDRLHHAPANQT